MQLITIKEHKLFEKRKEKGRKFFFFFLPSHIKMGFFGPPSCLSLLCCLLIISCCHCRSQLFFISRSRLCNNDIRSVSLKSNFKSRQMASRIKPSLTPHVENLTKWFWKRQKYELLRSPEQDTRRDIILAPWTLAPVQASLLPASLQGVRQNKDERNHRSNPQCVTGPYILWISC